MNSIEIGGKIYFFEIKRKSIKRLNLRLKSKSEFTITCPRQTTGQEIKHYIESHAKWIASRSERVVLKANIYKLTEVEIGGTTYRIEHDERLRKGWAFLEEEKMIYFKNLKSLEKCLKQKALGLISGETEKLARWHNLSYGRISLRNQKTRFGSCSFRGNLSFNWQIIFFPPDKFRHVILHELVHLVVKNHSKRFWQKLEEFDPEAIGNNRWLKTEGPKKFLF